MIFIVIHGDQALKSGQERLQERECDASGQFHCLAWENFLRPPSQTFLQHRLKFKIRHHCSSGLNIQIQNMEFSKILAPPSPYSLGLGLERVQRLYRLCITEHFLRTTNALSTKNWVARFRRAGYISQNTDHTRQLYSLRISSWLPKGGLSGGQRHKKVAATCLLQLLLAHHHLCPTSLLPSSLISSLPSSLPTIIIVIIDIFVVITFVTIAVKSICIIAIT